MEDDKIRDALQDMEAALKERGEQRYLLRLYVAGTTPRSARAIANIRKICEEKLQGRYDLEVVDIYQRPDVADGEQIIAVPTLVKRLPLPLRKVIGDLSDKNQVIVGLGLKPKDEETHE